MGWIDVHTHLNFLKDTTPEQAMAEARAVGVTRFITIGTEPADHPVVLALAEKFYPEVACTLGLHPHEGKVYTDELDAYLRANVARKEVVAVGEIGLDYYYDSSPRDLQQEAFRRQLKVAEDFKMPIEIHTRDAEEDTIAILKEFGGRIRGIVHCFTGTQWLAKEALDLGLDISFSGVITFKNAEPLREVVKFVPLDRLHVETDAPFLSPVPMRGRSNVPAYVVHTAKAVCALKGITEDALLTATLENAHRTFPKLQP
ncbi:MAG: TatD family hydrolase [Bdellovibrionota bacterium]